MSEDDDGLMLNFATTSSDGLKQKKSVKVSGGKWKDRRMNQLKLQGRGKGTFSKKKNEFNEINNSGSGSNSVPVTEVNRKRPETHDFTAVKRPKPTGSGEPRDNNTIVSSLFTQNPEISKRDYEKEIDITQLNPSNAPLLNESADFVNLGITAQLNHTLTGIMKYNKPTKIQRLVIPKLLASSPSDIFMQAQTGSGKTLAFTIPILEKLTSSKEKLNRHSGLFAIILTPTRELASQIYQFLEEKLCRSSCNWIVPGIVIGGEKKKSEKARIRKGVNLLVATPGRLVDHIENTESLDLSKVRYLVMDEGDRLMELGFEETITKILDKLTKDFSFNLGIMTDILPKRRVNVLCSATLKSNVRKLGEISLTNAELITCNDDKNVEDHMKAPEQLIQEIVVVPPKLRFVSLTGTLKNLTNDKSTTSKTVVFFSCSDSVDFHFIALSRGGKRFKFEEKKNKKKGTEDQHDNDENHVTAITGPLINENTMLYKLHGSLSQQARTATLNHFSKNDTNNTILFCTDVASRGLDLPDIKNVVEFDPPFTIADHLHRVGRTARLGLRGLSVLFLLPGDEEKYIEKIKQVHEENNLRFENYEKVLEKAFGQNAEDLKEGEEKRKGNKFNREGQWDMHATTFQLDLERWLLEDPRAKEIATNAFISHIRAYATHLSSERDCFNVKKIHLGHLAKSFGLRETPKKLANNSFKDGKKEKKEDSKTKMLRMAKIAMRSQNDEFNFA